METNETSRFVFDLLDEINQFVEKTHPNDDDIDYLYAPQIQCMVNDHVKKKDMQFSNHSQRLTHFILYLNTEMENCIWIKNDPILNLSRYMHGKPILKSVYCKVVEFLNLRPYVSEMIMSTPYCFNRGVVNIALNKISIMDGLPQLLASEELIIALLKSIKRSPIKYSLQSEFCSHFNQAMAIFNLDNIPYDMRRLDYEAEQKMLTKYNGFRVKSVFNLFVELIKFKSSPDTYRQYPMYKLKVLRDFELPTDVGSTLFKTLFDLIMRKCMNMCNFSVDTWLSWYEIEVVEEDTNLQAAIGHLCFELCAFIDNGTINEHYLKEFRPILGNIAIEKIDFTDVDTSDIDTMINRLGNCPKFHINGWIKKMILNHDVFTNPRAIEILENYVECIDYNCFKNIIDQYMIYYKSGGILFESFGKIIYKGIQYLDIDDKTNILKHIISNYPDNMFFITSEFDDELHYVVHNEDNDTIDQKDLLTKIIWLVLQQPKEMFHLLISQYVKSVCGLPVKSVESKKLCLYQVLVVMHLYMEPSYVYSEYKNWLDLKSRVPLEQHKRLFNWLLAATRNLHLIRAKTFLANVIVPLLSPSSNYDHTMYLINLIKFFLGECQMLTQTDKDLWDALVTRLAKLLDDARWTIDSYSSVKVELCESIIVCLQPLLQFAVYIAKPPELESIKNELSSLHLLTRSHLLCLWSSEYITIEGMEEQFIMTVQSNSHISYSNLNGSSNQGVQEEFIFSIATYIPKFTMHEMKSFVVNYLHSTNAENINEASFFLMDCVMSAFMRVIVYLKTAMQNEPYNDECAWDYLGNAIVNFLDAVNSTRMCGIYHEELIKDVKIAFTSVTKIIMVIKQLKNTRQLPLLITIRRIIHVIFTRLDAESISKLLTLLASIKTKNSKDTLENTVETLIDKLKTKPLLPTITLQ